MRPKLSRFFNQAATPRKRRSTSGFMSGAVSALPPPPVFTLPVRRPPSRFMPSRFSLSRFLVKHGILHGRRHRYNAHSLRGMRR